LRSIGVINGNMSRIINHSVDNISFIQAGVVNLKPLLTGYDVILLQQVLENSYEPNKI